jgi:hypothetical protein
MHLDWTKNHQAFFVVSRPGAGTLKIRHPVKWVNATNAPLVNKRFPTVTHN